MVAALSIAGCGVLSGDDTTTACVVRLHGRSQSGEPTRTVDGIVEVAPTGNGEFGFGRQWLYGGQADFNDAQAVVRTAIDDAGCTDIVINGFSNGGAFAARIYCDGLTFDGRLRGIVIDDPVADGITNGCDPTGETDLALYWTGVIEDRLPAGTDCRDVEFECAGNLIIGIEAMAANLGTELLPSPFDQHRWFRDAPEIRTFLPTEG